MPLEPKPDKDKEADERDREEKAIRTRNRKGGAGYDPTDVSELFANKVFEAIRLRFRGQPENIPSIELSGKGRSVDGERPPASATQGPHAKMNMNRDEIASMVKRVRKGKLPGMEVANESAWQRKEGKNKEGGLNEKGRKAYERENPGSDLKAPVSAAQAKKSKGGKAAKRRKSFCARMGGMPGPMKDEKGRPTRKALALRKWDC